MTRYKNTLQLTSNIINPNPTSTCLTLTPSKLQSIHSIQNIIQIARLDSAKQHKIYHQIELKKIRIQCEQNKLKNKFEDILSSSRFRRKEQSLVPYKNNNSKNSGFQRVMYEQIKKKEKKKNCGRILEEILSKQNNLNVSYLLNANLQELYMSQHHNNSNMHAIFDNKKIMIRSNLSKDVQEDVLNQQNEKQKQDSGLFGRQKLVQKRSYSEAFSNGEIKVKKNSKIMKNIIIKNCGK